MGRGPSRNAGVTGSSVLSRSPRRNNERGRPAPLSASSARCLVRRLDRFGRAAAEFAAAFTGRQVCVSLGP